MTRLTTQKIRLSLALALAVAVMTLSGLSFVRKLETFRDPGFSTLPGVLPVTVETVAEGFPADLRPGDQILLANAETVRSARTLRASLLAESSRSEIAVMRGENLVELTIPPPRLQLDLSYLAQALIGAIYLLIGLYTVVRDQGRQSRLFYLWCVTSSLFYILVSTPTSLLLVDSLGRSIYVIEEAARLLVPPLTLHFFLTIPKGLRRRPVVRRGIPFLYLPAAVLATLQLDLILNRGRWLLGSPSADGWGTTIGLLDRLEIVLFLVYAVAAAGLLLTFSRREIEREEKRQLLWIALGMVGGYAPFALLYAVPWTLGVQGPALLEVAAVLPLALVPLTFAYAILRYRLWDITIIARDVATYTLTLLFGVLGFSVLRLFVERNVPEAAGMSRNVLTFASALVVGGLLVPARQRIGSTLERAYYRSGFSKRRALAELGRELLHERDLERLTRALLEQLEDALGLDSTNLLLAESSRLVPIRWQDDLELPLSAFGDDFWEADLETLTGIALPEHTGAGPHRLFARGYRYAFPLTVRERRVAVLLCGYRLGDTPLTSEDQDLVRQVLNQAALAIENAHLVERLQIQLRETRELKQYNESIIEASPAGIAVLGADDRILSANLAFAALAGTDPGAVRRRHVQEVMPLDRLPDAAEGLSEVVLRDPAGEERHLQVSVSAFSSGSGSLRVLLLTDITQRVAMERDLEEKGRLAALGVMAAGIAHEVNTPLTGISSYAQMLLSSTDPEDPRYELLEKVERQTFRASKIVNNLLSLARSRSREPQAIDLSEVMAECEDLLSERFERHQVALETELTANLAPIEARDGELQQVFTNLYLNAIEAMSGQTGGRLRVEARPTTNGIEVTVEDNGPGIPKALREKVFEPFFSTKQSQGGTGLGLSISAEIVRRSGGEMRILDARDGSGCRFVVDLRSAEA